MAFVLEKSELIHFNKGRKQWTNRLDLAQPGRGTSPVRPTGSARFLGIWLDWKLNWKAHLGAVERKLSTQSYTLSRIAAKTWGLGLAKAREVLKVHPVSASLRRVVLLHPHRKGR
jgi:hypothetical protein